MEVLVAAAILTTAAGIYLGVLVQTSVLSETNQMEDLALNAAQSKIEEISQSNISMIMTNYHNKTFPVAGLVPPAGQANPLLVTVTGSNQLFHVTVTVRWLQRGRVIQRSVSTTVVNKG